MPKFQKANLLGAVLALALLVGCDSLPQNKSADGDNDVPTPPAATASQDQAEQQQSQAPATQVPVSFFLAQEQEDEGLTELKLIDGSIWALPDAVLTRADLASVEPRRTTDGQAFVRFGFNEQGAARLAEISQRFAGNLLMLAVGNDVVGLTRIAGTSGDVLDVGMASDEQAIAVAGAVADGGQPQQPAEE